jgi:hypothetical protein
MPSPWDTFKVSALSIRPHQQKNERLVLYNINLPVNLISNENVFNVIRDTIVHDFNNNPSVYFQLSAVYTLVNHKTGDIRTWSGSFNPRNRQPSQLSTHRRFEADTFIEFAQQHSSVERTTQILTANYIGAGKNSDWTLQDLKSIVFSFQCKLPASHRLFHQRPRLQHVGNNPHKEHEFNLEAG